MAVPSQACVPPQAARHLRSPVLLQSTTDTFTFPQTPASPDQTLMEEDVATPKVSYVSTEVSTKTKSEKRLLNGFFLHREKSLILLSSLRLYFVSSACLF